MGSKVPLPKWASDPCIMGIDEAGHGPVLDPETKSWLEDHQHSVFGFPTLVRFSWGTCTPYFKSNVEVLWESDKTDEDGSSTRSGKRQLKLSNVGFTGLKRKSEEIESRGKGRSKFFPGS